MRTAPGPASPGRSGHRDHLGRRRAARRLTSWFDLLDPSLKGKVAPPHDPLGAFTLPRRTARLRPGRTVTEDQLADIKDLLSQIIAQSKGVSPSFGDMTTLLVSGDAVACWQGWSAMNNFAKDAGKDTVKTIIPKEGGWTYCDAYAIPSTVDNLDTAHAWINLALDPQVNAENAEYLVAGVTVEAAVPLLDEGHRVALLDYSDVESFFAKRAAPTTRAADGVGRVLDVPAVAGDLAGAQGGAPRDSRQNEPLGS